MDNDEASTVLGFSDSEGVTLDSVKRKFKLKVSAKNVSLVNLNKHCLYKLKSIARSFGHSMLDRVFRRAVESAVMFLNDDEWCVDLSVSGFKSVTHQLFLKTLEKKYSIKNKENKYIPFEMIIPSIKVPHVKDLTFPALKIQATSSLRELNLRLSGDSSLIFILFSLRKCIELFMKASVVPLKECYLSPDVSSDAEDSSGSPIEKKKAYKRVLIQESSDDSSEVDVDQQQQVVDEKQETLKKNQETMNKYQETRNENQEAINAKQETSNETNVGNISESDYPPSPIFKKKAPFQKNALEMKCSACALLYLSTNMVSMVKDDMPIPLECTSKCLDPEVSDPLAEMAFSLAAMASMTENIVNKNTTETFNVNFKRICLNVLDKIDAGRETFYLQLLSNLRRMKIQEADRAVAVMNEIVDDCILSENVTSFEERFIQNKAARRSILSYLKSTGAFFSVISVVESWYKMFLKRMNLLKILPLQLGFIVKLFSEISVAESRVEHHKNMSHVARKVLGAIGGGRVGVVELTKKEFRVGQTGRTITITQDLFLYLNEVENTVISFSFSGQLTLAQQINLKETLYERRENRILTNEWIYYLKETISNKHVGCLLDLVLNRVPCDEAKKEVQNKEPVKTDAHDEGILETNAKPEVVRNVIKDDFGQEQHCILTTAFKVEKKQLLDYWLPNEKMNVVRKFDAKKVVSDWPKMYGGVCPLNITYNYVPKYQSRKGNANFGKIVGKCVICNSTHSFIVEQNPFNEVIEGGLIKYETLMDMVVDVEVDGSFFVEDGEEPCIKNPVHMKEKARGIFLKGRERELLGDLAAQQGLGATYRQQMAFARENEIEMGNLTSMRSYPVIKMAKQEQEKKQRGGSTFYESARNVLFAQEKDVSPEFPDLAAAKLLPGMIRVLQEYPFKIMLSNFEMLIIGAKYFTQVGETCIYIDSSGKFWQDRKKTGKELLNTALVLQPLAHGLSPFPIYELISESNKTQDFIDLIQNAWNNMAQSLNNQIIPYPTYAVSDLSFPNIHALLATFNKIKLHEYMKMSYDCLMKGSKIKAATIVTICENHLVPAILKTSRLHTQEKVIADTVVAGLMLVLRADTMENAMNIWENLVKVHCEKSVNENARQNVKAASLGKLNDFEMITDFGDDTPPDEIIMYGNRRALRLNSEFYHLFQRTIERIEKMDQNVSLVTNSCYAPTLIKFLTKQYLSLFPLLSASVLNGGLKTNAHIELYWKTKRAIMAKVPTPQHWPAKLIGIQHQETRLLAKEIQHHALVPNLKFGGKKFSQKGKHPELMDDLRRQPGNEKFFMPTPSKKEKKEKKLNESFSGSRERWSMKKSRERGNNKELYMKNKIIDHEMIESRLDTNIRITGNDDKGGVIVTKQDIAWVIKEGSYVSDNAINAGLLLLDKRLNDQNNPKQPSDTIAVYSIHDLRLILFGETSLVRKGKFVCIMPRDFALNDFDVTQRQMNSSDPGSHFTLVSNLYCGENEVNCFETFAPFRNSGNLLTPYGRKLIRMLLGLVESDKQEVEVHSVNTALQKEAECGALSFAIALQLCFHYPLGGVHNQIQNVRGHLLSCLQRNELSDFTSLPNSVENEILFTINI